MLSGMRVGKGQICTTRVQCMRPWACQTSRFKNNNQSLKQTASTLRSCHSQLVKRQGFISSKLWGLLSVLEALETTGLEHFVPSCQRFLSCLVCFCETESLLVVKTGPFHISHICFPYQNRPSLARWLAQTTWAVNHRTFAESGFVSLVDCSIPIGSSVLCEWTQQTFSPSGSLQSCLRLGAQ